MNSDAMTASPTSAAPAKACPHCGEQILAVATKCKHCGSSLVDSTADAVKRQFKMSPVFTGLFVVIVAIFAASWLYSFNRTGSVTGKGFSDEDVVRIEQSIRAELTKGHMKVEDVQLIRESPRKLTGFAKVKVPFVGTVSKVCTATMGEDGQSMWQCK